MTEKAKYGHKKMVVWNNLDRIEWMIQRKIMNYIPKNLFKLRDQIDRAASSCCANFIEGYYSGSRKEYVKFLKYSKRSLAELQYWVEHIYKKMLIPKGVYLEFDDLCIKTMYLLNRLINSLEERAREGP